MNRFATAGFVAMGLVVVACSGALAPSEPSSTSDSASSEHDPVGAVTPTGAARGDAPAVDTGDAAADAATAVDATGVSDAAVPEAAVPDADAAPFCDTSATTQPFAPSTAVAGLVRQPNGPPLTDVRLTPDELRAFYTQAISAAGGGSLPYEATRASRELPFGDKRLMDLGWGARYGAFSPDGLVIYFVAGYKRSDEGVRGMFTAQRENVSSTFGPRSPFAAALNENDTSSAPFVVGTDVWFSRPVGPTDFDIFHVSLLPGAGPPAPESQLNVVGEQDREPVVSADGLTVFFARRTLMPGASHSRIMEANRATLQAPFAIRQVCELNTTGDERPTWLSPDGCRLYFTSSYTIRVASRCAP